MSITIWVNYHHIKSMFRAKWNQTLQIFPLAWNGEQTRNYLFYYLLTDNIFVYKRNCKDWSMQTRSSWRERANGTVQLEGWEVRNFLFCYLFTDYIFAWERNCAAVSMKMKACEWERADERVHIGACRWEYDNGNYFLTIDFHKKFFPLAWYGRKEE